jgi:hypothetical protein
VTPGDREQPDERVPRRLGRVLACAGRAPTWLWLICGCTSTLDLGSNDAGVAYDADCKPGTYTGTYACSESDGSLFAFAPNGSIAVTLVPIGISTLGLASDASLTTSAARSTSTLTGMLDCPTHKLKGAVTRVTLYSGIINIAIDGQGEFSATYEPDASPPALIDGVLGPPGLTSRCSWTAQLK